VIVFVHGGGNVSGYTADPVYDGAALAKATDSVVVTVNYRLGSFGFLNLAQLKSGTDPQEDSGNFALLDLDHRGLEAYRADALTMRDAFGPPNGWNGMLDHFATSPARPAGLRRRAEAMWRIIAASRTTRTDDDRAHAQPRLSD
jgi:hypothetical protein